MDPEALPEAFHVMSMGHWWGAVAQHDKKWPFQLLLTSSHLLCAPPALL